MVSIGGEKIILYVVVTDKGESFEEGTVARQQAVAFNTRSNSCFRRVSKENQSSLSFHIF